MLTKRIKTVDGQIIMDKTMHAPKGGVTLKGKKFKGGQFIPKEGGYQEAFEEKQKASESEKKPTAKTSSYKGIYADYKSNAKSELSKISYGQVMKDKPVKGLVKDNIDTISRNARNQLARYTPYLSAVSYSKARNIISDTLRYFKDPALRHADVKTVNNLMKDFVGKLVYQEVESNKAQFTDHGIRHIYGNIERANDLLDVFGAGSNVNKLLSTFIMVNHDLGYTAPDVRKGGAEGIAASKKHKQYSKYMASKERKFWNINKIFTSEQYDKILYVIETHNSSEMSREDLLATSVRISDNLVLFAKDKLPSMFSLIKGGGESLVRLGKAAKRNDEKVFNIERDKLYKKIDEGPLDRNLKRDLKAAVAKINLLTPKFTMGVLAGEISSIKSSKGKAVVKIKHNKWDSFLQKYFEMGQRQLKKFLGDYNIEEYDKDEYNIGDMLVLKVVR